MIDRFQIAQALLTYLRANTSYEVVADGQEKELSPNTIYLTEKLAFGQTRITLGVNDNDSANCFYQIDVRTPVSNGKGQNLSVCTEIQALFPKGKQTNLDNIHIDRVDCSQMTRVDNHLVSSLTVYFMGQG